MSKKCVDCGVDISDRGPRAERCVEHAEQRRLERARRLARQVRQERLDQGLCPHCGGKPAPGRAACAKSLKYQREYHVERRRKLKGLALIDEPRPASDETRKGSTRGRKRRPAKAA